MEVPRSQVRDFLEKAGAERIGSDAVDGLGDVLEGVAADIAREAQSTAATEGRVTVTAGDVRRAAGRLAVHDMSSPLPPEVVPEDVVERHYHLVHDELDEVIRKYWEG